MTLGELPQNFRQQLQPLQTSILRTTEALRNRLAAEVRHPTLTHPPPPVSQTVAEFQAPAFLPARGAILDFVTGADVKTIQEIGTKLFESLFQQDVYLLYKSALDAAHEATGKHLSIKLYAEPPELAYIPWETLYDKRGFHLCCTGTTLFARTATVNDEDLYIYDKPPIRILGVISAPKSFIGTPHELNTYAEQAALNLTLGSFSKDVKLGWTTAGTYRELARRLTKGDDGARWDVLLFIGHGVPGHIVLEKDGGNEYEFLKAEDLQGLLWQPLGPRLVILNSCRGAQSESGDRFASTAEILVRSGPIAAVIAMQFDISDIMGTTFSPAFFTNLMYNVSVQHAMYLTRLDLRRQGFSEWISPVLYMQNKDGMVVRPSAAAGGGSQ
ncbi:CHAT domain-containing protein [Bradyrhizobium liaoningense]|uniref:CHAT domain-containing protein n=1 Tax=Bradyrhizobium liaoningense TaxID=43992 RepID=UPI001BAA2097|nr:CHAT domain-containing protein [Bradyrhizobium liaoningense]MBR0948611.1 CHAT domain-containing protein [Bradyrhizobium liaoningense]